MPPVNTCPTCGRGVGCACRLSFVEKIRGLSIAQAAQPNRTFRRNYDSTLLDAQFGGTAKERREQYWDETKGMGHVKPDARGRLWHRNRTTNEVEPLDAKQTVEALGGPLD